jgi:hypothetical protein
MNYLTGWIFNSALECLLDAAHNNPFYFHAYVK